MIKFLLRLFYYSVYDFFKIIINLNKKYNYIVITPRLLSLLIKRVIIFDKYKYKIFIQKIRNYNDILTVYEVFSEEHYNLKKYMIFKNISEFFEKKNDKKKPLIVDCGSNIGSSSLYFSKLFKNSLIALIEPDKGNFEFSKKNITGDNFYFFNNAISNKRQTIGFESNKWDNRASQINPYSENKIECLTVEDVLSKINSLYCFPFLIKIDIEGYEKNLFINNYKWIDQFKIIIIELHDWMLPLEANSYNYLKALTNTMGDYRKRDLILSGENLISIRIDE